MRVSLSLVSRRILELLLQENAPLTTTKLAQRLRCSPRMVRYELKNVQLWLALNGAAIERRHNGIVVKAGGGEKRRELVELLWKKDPYECKFTSAERQLLILASLLTSLRPRSLYDFMDRLGVAKSTVLKDLKELKHVLQSYSVRLDRINRRGYKLTGNEFSVRQLLADLIFGIGKEQVNAKAIQSNVAPLGTVSLAHELLSALGSRDVMQDVEYIESVIEGAELRYGLRLSESSKKCFLIHVVIALVRLRAGYQVELDPEIENALRECPELYMAQEIAGAVESRYAVRFPKSEIVYLALHLLGAKRVEPQCQPFAGEKVDVVGLASSMLRAAEGFLGVRMTDPDIARILATHLLPVLYRLKYRLTIRNPLVSQMRERYPDVYQAAICAGEVFRSLTGLELPEEELAYVAMHIGAALERSDIKRRRVAIVCPSGLGTVRMVLSQVRLYFPQVEIVGTYAASEIPSQLNGSVDAIIATVPLPAARVPCLTVEPILTDEDIDRIEQLLSLLPVPKRDQDQGSDVPPLKLKITAIYFNAKCGDWREAVRLAGVLLFRNGFSEKRYGEAMVRQIETYGSYVVIRGGVAIPHARPQDGVLKPGMCLIRLKSPVIFPGAEGEPVKIILGLALNQRLAPRKIDALADILLEGKASKISEATTIKELVAHLDGLIE